MEVNMANIYWTGPKAPEQEAIKALMTELVECTDNTFTVRKESDDSGNHLGVYVEKNNPNENVGFIWKKILPPKFMGWRVIIMFCPIGYIKGVLNAPTREWY